MQALQHLQVTWRLETLTQNASLEEEKAERVTDVQWTEEYANWPRMWCRFSSMQQYKQCSLAAEVADQKFEEGADKRGKNVSKASNAKQYRYYASYYIQKASYRSRTKSMRKAASKLNRAINDARA